MAETPAAVRSAVMRAVKSKNTSPERLVRRLLHRQGYRYRLHRSDLPGKPDIVFPARRKIIFVHGCFWHGHDCRRGARLPKTNVAYWRDKIDRNRRRDARHLTALGEQGWSVLIVWECRLKEQGRLIDRLVEFLD